MTRYIIILTARKDKFDSAIAIVNWHYGFFNKIRQFVSKKWVARTYVGGTWFTPFNVLFYFLMFKYFQSWYIPKIEKVPKWKIQRQRRWLKIESDRKS